LAIALLTVGRVWWIVSRKWSVVGWAFAGVDRALEDRLGDRTRGVGDVGGGESVAGRGQGLDIGLGPCVHADNTADARLRKG
jgi:hypothetical protein